MFPAMSLTLTSDYQDNVPLEVDSVLPKAVRDLTSSQIGALKIWRGKRQHRLDDFFQVSSAPQSSPTTIIWQGNLAAVQRIGQAMTEGKMIVRGNVGDHLGAQLNGGTIEVHGDAGDFVGTSMQGGTITVRGSVGDHLGTCLPGAKRGMNRGTILVQGDAGCGVGQLMRRGTIVVGGQSGEGCGWNLIAGTILVLGGTTGLLGVEMRRGTIVDAQLRQDQPPHSKLLPTFTPGICQTVPILKLFQHQLSHFIFSAAVLAPLAAKFYRFHGDQNQGGRGEVFIAAKA